MIGFQGQHADKLHITYNMEGDGFQCDALANAGFTWTFYFHNQLVPEKGTTLGYSPLHSCILGMCDQLEEKYHNCWFDNLYLSVKFCKGSIQAHQRRLNSWAYLEKWVGTSEVCHTKRDEKCKQYLLCMRNCKGSSSPR